jgi:predicted PurR-regulated permease PerM
MLGIDQRIFKALWTLFVFALLLTGIYTIRLTVVIFALAIFFAQLLEPVIQLAGRAVPAKVSRLAVLAFVYVAMLALIGASFVAIGSRVAEQAAALAQKLPVVLQQDPVGNLWLPSWLEPARPRLAELLQDRIAELGQNVLPILARAGTEIVSGLGSVLSLVLVPILGFFFLKDGAKMRRGFVAMFTPDTRTTADDTLEDLHHMLARYIRALVLLSVCTFISHLIALSALGIPYAVLLAGIAGALELIPVVGPLTGATVILLVAAFSGYHHLLWIVIFLLVYRFFQDYVLNPLLMGSGVELHPVVVLFGVIAGEQIAGVPGMFFSVPLMAAIRVIMKRLHKEAPVTEDRDAW